MSFDTLVSFLTTIGLQVDGDFLCKHEADYVSKRLSKFYHQKNGIIDEHQILEYAKTIISDIEHVLVHIRSSEWFNYGRDYVLFVNEAYTYRVGTDAVIDLTEYGRDMKVSLVDYVKMKEFAYYGYKPANISIADQIIDFSFSFPIDFDEYLDEYPNPNNLSQKRSYTDCDESDEILPNAKKVCV